MGLIQKIVKAVVPAATAASIEAESRSWMIKCNVCGTEQSVWDMGGIRWGASGKPSLRAKCQPCGQNQWHTMYKSE